jgi:sulfur-oxidizing protein SoxA
MRRVARRIDRLLTRARSPRRGEGWGEGAQTARPCPLLSPAGSGRRTPRPLTIAVLATLLIGAVAARAADIPLDERRSGSEFMSADSRAMQNDDTENPGMLAVLDGEALWNEKTGASGKSCADCHGDAKASMKGVAARYPAVIPALGRPVDLEQRINMSRADDQQSQPLAFESKDLLALAAYIGLQSRGMPIAVTDDAAAKHFIDNGRAIFERRQGQLDLSCAQCHNDNWGKRLASSPVPQAHPTGYPIYRLEWQEVGSLQRRLRGCMSAMRAEPYAYGAPELVDLEFYLMWRARGMAMETPGVRP